MVDKNTGLIFVYGTLKENSGPYSFARYFDKVRIGVRPATIRGSLYDLGYFPAMIVGGYSTVYGEIHEYKHINHVLQLMDKVEGFISTDDNYNLYRRVKIEAIPLDDGGPVIVYAYEFVQSVEGYPKITSGKWEMNDGQTQQA